MVAYDRVVRPSRWSRRARLCAWVGVFAVLTTLGYSAGAVSSARAPRLDALYDWRTAAFQLVAYGFLAVVGLLLSAGRSVREVLALRRPRSWRRAALLILGVEVAWLSVSLGVAALVGVEGRELLPPRFHDDSRLLQFALNAAIAGLVAPAVEEALARGVGYALLEPSGAVVAVLWTGLAFALAHGVVRDLPAILALGIGFSFLRARTGSLYPSLIVHVFTNSLALLASLAR